MICGNDRPQDDFAGVAPQAKLIVVKLKRAPQKLYDFYFIPDRKIVYSEVDVMRAVHFADEFAGQKGAPAVFCMALGCNNGSTRELRIFQSIWTISRQKEAGPWLRQRAMRRTAGIIIKGA